MSQCVIHYQASQSSKYIQSWHGMWQKKTSMWTLSWPKSELGFSNWDGMLLAIGTAC